MLLYLRWINLSIFIGLLYIYIYLLALKSKNHHNLSIYPSIHLSTSTFYIYLLMYLCLSVCIIISIHLLYSINKSTYSSIYNNIHLPIYLHLYLQGGPKKSLWCDLDEKCLWNSKKNYGVFLSIYSHLLKKLELSKLCRKKL